MKTKFIIGYLTVIGLIVGCTVTLIKVKKSEEIDIGVEKNLDSISIGDDFDLDLNRKKKDTIKDKRKEL